MSAASKEAISLEALVHAERKKNTEIKLAHAEAQSKWLDEKTLLNNGRETKDSEMRLKTIGEVRMKNLMKRGALRILLSSINLKHRSAMGNCTKRWQCGVIHAKVQEASESGKEDYSSLEGSLASMKKELEACKAAHAREAAIHDQGIKSKIREHSSAHTQEVEEFKIKITTLTVALEAEKEKRGAEAEANIVARTSLEEQVIPFYYLF